MCHLPQLVPAAGFNVQDQRMDLPLADQIVLFLCIGCVAN